MKVRLADAGKNAEPASADEEKHSFSWMRFIGWVLVILAGYVLGSGPIVMMFQSGRIPQNSFILKCYDPLDWVYFETPMHKPLGMYLHLWSKRFDKDGEIQN